jgi:pimeloyl-ACP methyl ester carboxylesterase
MRWSAHGNRRGGRARVRRRQPARPGEALAPALVMVGELDTPDFQGIAQTIERGVSQVRRISLPGVGDLANLEDPERFNDILFRFLDSTLSGG